MRITKDPYDGNFAHDFHSFVIKLNGTPLINSTLYWADDVTNEVCFLKKDSDGECPLLQVPHEKGQRFVPEGIEAPGEIEIIEPVTRPPLTKCLLKNIKAVKWWAR